MEEAHNVFISFLPDVFIELATRSEMQINAGVVFFVDISGFTRITEELMKTGAAGLEELLGLLNWYVGKMAHRIYLYGGDVLKFGGDAILAVWNQQSDVKTRKKPCTALLVRKAVRCALYIQRHLGAYSPTTSVQVKIIITVGTLEHSIVGNNLGLSYVSLGEAVREIHGADDLCKPGNILVMRSAADYCSDIDYFVEDTDADGNIKIISVYDVTGKEDEEDVEINIKEVDLESSEDHFDIARPRVSAAIGKVIRPSIIQKLRMFISAPVLEQIDSHLPLDMLNELRQTGVIFVHLVPKPGVNYSKLKDIVNKAVCIALSVLWRKGCLNKVSAFDKDVTLLAIFGLPGYGYQHQSLNALTCAHAMFGQLEQEIGWDTVSIGVTTGLLYVGTMGHKIRQEFTVLGSVVNRAARLMVAYPGQITADDETRVSSRLPDNLFIQQEERHMKGIERGGRYYAFQDKSMRRRLTTMRLGHGPLLGRASEMLLLEQQLGGLSRGQDVGLVLEAPPFVGSSRLLRDMAGLAAARGFPVIGYMVDEMEIPSPFSFVLWLLAEMLPKLTTIASRERTEYLLGSLKHETETEFVEYWHSENLQLLEQFVTFLPKNLVLVIDNVHFMDFLSWQFVRHTLLKTPSIMLVLNLCRNSSRIQEIKQHQFMKFFKLTKLDEKYFVPLVCELLDVDAVDSKLPIMLHNIKGEPGLLKKVLEEFHLWFTFDTMKSSIAYRTAEVHPRLKEKADPENVFSVCSLTEEVSTVGHLPLHQAVMVVVNNLQLYGRALLKVAAVVGEAFRRETLLAVLPNQDSKQTLEAIKELFERGILMCGIKNRHGMGDGWDQDLVCYCKFDETSATTDLPQYAYCRYLRFATTEMFNSIKKLLLKSWKNMIHKQLIQYFEKQLENETFKKKCIFCKDPRYIEEQLEDQEDEEHELKEDEHLTNCGSERYRAELYLDLILQFAELNDYHEVACKYMAAQSLMKMNYITQAENLLNAAEDLCIGKERIVPEELRKNFLANITALMAKVRVRHWRNVMKNI
ncbi:adenylate cyclase type 10-like [Bacillus rossius redtenbacheri]|uniref:adenylate cyclase type 10-like n=1 Tax=Bacillus rossius redtenbacheri TaxID=93214 RepID=UPI002FDECC48